MADVAYYYGEDANVTGLFHYKQPDVPSTVAFDYVNSHALTTRLSADKGKAVTPNGMQYRIIALDKNAERMTLPVLRHLANLVAQGVPLCGNKPTKALGKEVDQAEFNQLVAQIWDSNRPNVYASKRIGEALQALGVQPDVYCEDMDSLRYVHRTTQDSEIYWLNNTA